MIIVDLVCRPWCPVSSFKDYSFIIVMYGAFCCNTTSGHQVRLEARVSGTLRGLNKTDGHKIA